MEIRIKPEVVQSRLVYDQQDKVTPERARARLIDHICNRSSRGEGTYVFWMEKRRRRVRYVQEVTRTGEPTKKAPKRVVTPTYWCYRIHFIPRRLLICSRQAVRRLCNTNTTGLSKRDKGLNMNTTQQTIRDLFSTAPEPITLCGSRGFAMRYPEIIKVNEDTDWDFYAKHTPQMCKWMEIMGLARALLLTLPMRITTRSGSLPRLSTTAH